MSRLAPHEIDDIRARNPVADIAGQYVELRRAGRRMVGACPICGGRKTSQRFEVFEDGASWACAVCPDGGDVIRLVEKAEACSFVQAIERLGGRIARDDAAVQAAVAEREAKRATREREAATYREAERGRLWRQWNAPQVLPINGTIVERYLAGRGQLIPERCPGLRFAPTAIYWFGETRDGGGRTSPRALHTGPAMLGAFIRADGNFGGLHITWLDESDPPRKIQLAHPETGELLPAKKMRGSKAGAHIAVTLNRAPRRLVIGEGIETVLSIYTALVRAGRPLDDMAFWAAGDLGNLAGRAIASIPHPMLKRPDGRAQTVPNATPDPDDVGQAIPDSVDELILLGDGDSEPVMTHFAMQRAARRYARPGRTVRIAFAPAGRDFNDLLRDAE